MPFVGSPLGRFGGYFGVVLGLLGERFDRFRQLTDRFQPYNHHQRNHWTLLYRIQPIPPQRAPPEPV